MIGIKTNSMQPKFKGTINIDKQISQHEVAKGQKRSYDASAENITHYVEKHLPADHYVNILYTQDYESNPKAKNREINLEHYINDQLQGGTSLKAKASAVNKFVRICSIFTRKIQDKPYYIKNCKSKQSQVDKSEIKSANDSVAGVSAGPEPVSPTSTIQTPDAASAVITPFGEDDDGIVDGTLISTPPQEAQNPTKKSPWSLNCFGPACGNITLNDLSNLASQAGEGARKGLGQVLVNIGEYLSTQPTPETK